MNDNQNIAKSQAQNAKILRYLQEGNTLTSIQALELFGCLRLSGRIYDLARVRGYSIISRRIKTPSGKWVAEYSMKKQTAE